MTTIRPAALPATATGTITLGSELTVNRMGFGAMRLTGPRIWGPPKNRAQAVRVLPDREGYEGAGSPIFPPCQWSAMTVPLPPRQCSSIGGR
jgi:hypothetical protein